MQRKKRNQQTKIIIINFCIAAVLAIIAGSLAAYTSLSSAKRVVSTTGTTQLFSSNVLYEFDSGKEPSTRVMSFAKESETNTFKFTVCNYAQGDKTSWASKDINYNLYVALLDSDGTIVTDNDVLSKYTLTYANSDGTETAQVFSSAIDTAAVTVTGTLTYTQDGYAEDTYSITLPSVDMEDYKIKIIATSDVEEYKSLGRIISATVSSASTHWTGEFTDSIVDDSSHTPSELGSVNTRISGQENEVMVITWDTDYFEIDPWFLQDLESELSGLGKAYTIATDSDKHSKTLTFEVGGEGQPQQYYISFYRTQSAKSVDEDWKQLKGHITFGYESLDNEAKK